MCIIAITEYTLYCTCTIDKQGVCNVYFNSSTIVHDMMLLEL